MKDVFLLFKSLAEKRRMVLSLAKDDFRKRFVGSYFGIVWLFLQPLATVVIYAFIFGPYGFKSSPPVPDTSYVIWLIPGLVPWFFFSETINLLTGILQEYQYLVKKVVFPVELLLVIKLASCFFVHLCFVAIMTAAFLISGKIPMISWLQIFYYSFAASVLALGIGYFTSAVNVFFKDMQSIVGIALQFGIWMCPIMYDETLFTSKAPWVGTLLKINPLYYIVAGYRDSMLTGDWFYRRPGLTVYFWIVTMALFMLGLHFFKKLRPHFSDVL